MRISDVILAPGMGGFFYDDQMAIRQGAEQNGFTYLGTPVTSGFSSIRIPSASMGIGLVLGDGSVAWGDMVSVQYSGGGGRDQLFDTDRIKRIISDIVQPRLIGLNVTNVVSACRDALAPFGGEGLPVAVEYGVSQALLRAAAFSCKKTMAEVVCESMGLKTPISRIPIYSQSGDARKTNVDKMIMKSVEILPHGLINSRAKFGESGVVFRDFVRWVVARIGTLGSKEYRPTLHFDVYGWVGLEFGLDPARIAEFVAQVSEDASGFDLNIECPADFGSTAGQLEGYGQICHEVNKLGIPARIVVDEYCNTLKDVERFASENAAHIVQIKTPDIGSVIDTAKAVLICKDNGVGAFVGGSCSETDLSTRTTVNVALATQADMMLAKPGMGVDEGLSIVGNEQSRVLATLRTRSALRSQN